MPAHRDWDFHKYMQNVISFLPRYHHSDIHTSVSKACFILYPYVATGAVQGSEVQGARQHTEPCTGCRACSSQNPQSK